MQEKLDKTIESICDWINENLVYTGAADEAMMMPNMIFALSDLVSSRTDQDLEKRIADLEGQVQGQQINTFMPEDSNGKSMPNSEKIPKPYFN